MKRSRLVAAAVGAVSVLSFAVVPAASASPAHPAAADRVAASATVQRLAVGLPPVSNIPTGTDWYITSGAFSGQVWGCWYVTHCNITSFNAINYTYIAPTPGSWQEYNIGEYPVGGGGNCMTFNSNGGTIDPETCTGVDAQLWASSESGGVWLFWNKYFNEHYPGFCVAPHSAVITDNYPGGEMYLACPLLSGGNQFSNHQYWYSTVA